MNEARNALERRLPRSSSSAFRVIWRRLLQEPRRESMKQRGAGSGSSPGARSLAAALLPSGDCEVDGGSSTNGGRVSGGSCVVRACKIWSRCDARRFSQSRLGLTSVSSRSHLGGVAISQAPSLGISLPPAPPLLRWRLSPVPSSNAPRATAVNHSVMLNSLRCRHRWHVCPSSVPQCRG